MKRGDLIAAAAVLSAAAAVFLITGIFSKKAETVTVSQNNSAVYSGSIKTDKRIELSGNTVVIKDGFAYMEEANCKNQICVRHKKISRSGESIVCLPNQVIIEIE